MNKLLIMLALISFFAMWGFVCCSVELPWADPNKELYKLLGFISGIISAILLICLNKD